MVRPKGPGDHVLLRGDAAYLRGVRAAITSALAKQPASFVHWDDDDDEFVTTVVCAAPKKPIGFRKDKR